MVRQILLKCFEFFLKLSLIINKHLKKIKFQAQLNDPLTCAWYLIFTVNFDKSFWQMQCEYRKYENDLIVLVK